MTMAKYAGLSILAALFLALFIVTAQAIGLWAGVWAILGTVAFVLTMAHAIGMIVMESWWPWDK